MWSKIFAPPANIHNISNINDLIYVFDTVWFYITEVKYEKYNNAPQIQNFSDTSQADLQLKVFVKTITLLHSCIYPQHNYI